MGKPVLSVTNLSVENNKTKRKIVDDISFDVCEGEVVVLSGANGCGKSTILKAIIGRGLEPERSKTSGKVIVFYATDISAISSERPILKVENPDEIRTRVAYVDQEDDYESKGKKMTVRTFFDISAESYIESKRLSKAEMVEILKKYAPAYDGGVQFDLKTKLKQLSGGQRRLLSIISAIAVREDAVLFVIDEPLNNLDYNNMRNVSNLINSIHRENPKSAFLIVTHCRIFPFVTKRIEIAMGRITETVQDSNLYHCVGKLNDNGYYCDS
jgi:ABC-type multidrug transport system ATPase subunit